MKRILFILCLCALSISSLLAQESADLNELIAAEPKLRRFAAALAATEWDELLGGDGPYTVFAPTDQAFAAAFARLETTEAEFFADSERLSSLLRFHIIAEAHAIAELSERTSVMTERRSSLVLSIRDGQLLLNEEARILNGDIAAANGRLHVVDTVLLAPGEFAIADAENSAYLRLGIAIVSAIAALYLASVAWRWRLVQQEEAALRGRLSEREGET